MAFGVKGARRGRAWILRDTGRDRPSEGQRRAPDAASRALDLLLEWERRAEASLPAHLFAELGPVVGWTWPSGAAQA